MERSKSRYFIALMRETIKKIMSVCRSCSINSIKLINGRRFLSIIMLRDGVSYVLGLGEKFHGFQRPIKKIRHEHRECMHLNLIFEANSQMEPFFRTDTSMSVDRTGEDAEQLTSGSAHGNSVNTSAKGASILGKVSQVPENLRTKLFIAAPMVKASDIAYRILCKVGHLIH